MTDSTTTSKTPDARALGGEKALVTGGGRGIGAAVAERLAALGAEVTIVGRDAARLEASGSRMRASTGSPVHCVPADVTDPAAVFEAFEQARRAMGDPTILVNNAGAVETAAFPRTDPGLWQRMIAVNLNAAFYACREALPAMLRRGSGRIVNVASTAGLRGYRYVAAYAAAKHGLVGLTRALALELAHRGITVNAVCPGYTDTDLVKASVEKTAARTGRTPEDIRAELMKVNPQGRFVRPEEVADAVVWLCLPEQRSITGQLIVVDGGETAG